MKDLVTPPKQNRQSVGVVMNLFTDHGCDGEF